MLIAKLTIGYDRGLALNDENDLKAGEGAQQALIAHKGFRTADGKVIRGLGTHYRSDADMELVKERDADANRIRTEFRKRFLATPIDGLYVVPSRGIARGFITGLGHRDDINVRVTEFELASPDGLDGGELTEWANRIKNQLSSVSLGRSKEADEDGLRALETLAGCPVLKKETGTRIKELVAALRAEKITRVELKRNLQTLDVQIEQGPLLSPRRAPSLV